MKTENQKMTSLQLKYADNKNIRKSGMKRSKTTTTIGIAAISTVACLQPYHAFTTTSSSQSGRRARSAMLNGRVAYITSFQASNTEASLEIAGNGSTNFYMRLPTSLWYRDGDSEDSQERMKEHDAAITPLMASHEREGWWNSLFSLSVHEGGSGLKKQENMDKYLEFLDRRYNRLHSDESHGVNKNKGGISTAWNWLFETTLGTEPKPISLTQAMHDDALYVLGVAELASERLLQKHQHMVHTHQGNTVDMSLDAINISMKPVSQMKSESSLFRKLQARKAAYTVAMQSKALRLLTTCFVVMAKITMAFLKSVSNILLLKLKTPYKLSAAVIMKMVIQPYKRIVAKDV